MKFFTYTIAVAALVASADAAAVSSLRRHRHHPSHNEFVSTLPDVRPDTVTEEDIAAHESARNEAAKVKKSVGDMFAEYLSVVCTDSAPCKDGERGAPTGMSSFLISSSSHSAITIKKAHAQAGV